MLEGWVESYRSPKIMHIFNLIYLDNIPRVCQSKEFLKNEARGYFNNKIGLDFKSLTSSFTQLSFFQNGDCIVDYSLLLFGCNQLE